MTRPYNLMVLSWRPKKSQEKVEENVNITNVYFIQVVVNKLKWSSLTSIYKRASKMVGNQSMLK